jgi:apolipoprotein N-acyltransferase
VADPLLLPAVSGLLLALSLPPFPFGLLSFIALVPFGVSLLERGVDAGGAAQSVRGGFWLGVVLFAVVLHWIPFSLPGRLWLGLPLFVAVVMILALFPAIVGWTVHHLLRARVPIWLALPLAWTACEWLRGALPGGFAFPWAGLPLSLTAWPRALGLPAIGGEHAVSFWIALVNGLLAAAVVQRRAGRGSVWPLIAAAVVVGVVPLILPMGGPSSAEDAPAARTARVALIQTAVPQEVREDPEAGARAMAATLDRLLPSVAPGSADLIVLPETAFLLPLESPAGRPHLEMLRAHAQRLDAPLLVGALGMVADTSDEERRDVFNSVFLIYAEGVRGRYDKRHLVPGVERVPLLPARLAAAVGDTAIYAMGTPRTLTAPTPSGEVTIGALVCYESAFGGLARAHVRDGAELLVNVTNDAWFGEGTLGAGARAQHEAHLVLRAVENGVPVVRSANGGVAMVVDPDGRVTRVAAAGEEAVEVVTVELTGAPRRFGWLRGAFGPASALLALLCAGVGWGGASRHQRAASPTGPSQTLR